MNYGRDNLKLVLRNIVRRYHGLQVFRNGALCACFYVHVNHVPKQALLVYRNTK